MSINGRWPAFRGRAMSVAVQGTRYGHQNGLIMAQFVDVTLPAAYNIRWALRIKNVWPSTAGRSRCTSRSSR
jgi:hypothetical protein